MDLQIAAALAIDFSRPQQPVLPFFGQPNQQQQVPPVNGNGTHDSTRISQESTSGNNLDLSALAPLLNGLAANYGGGSQEGGQEITEAAEALKGAAKKLRGAGRSLRKAAKKLRGNGKGKKGDKGKKGCKCKQAKGQEGGGTPPSGGATPSGGSSPTPPSGSTPRPPSGGTPPVGGSTPRPPSGGTAPVGGSRPPSTQGGSPLNKSGTTGGPLGQSQGTQPPGGKLGSLSPQLDRYDATVMKEAERWGVPPERIKAMMAIESGGNPDAHQVNPTYGDTHGLMQINAKIWGGEAARLGYDLNTPEGQIGMASYLLKKGYEATGSWDGASSWYFNPSGTGDSVNGTSNAQYVARVNELIAQMRGG